ncbi:hypothetical protein ACFVRR_06240 [Gottfriedia sp. NPDC057948]|uniref:hypothetical protein n=1 Tax=Gottfriedia sp. NPDC057948 TaxID=3346287 RepID=UPI0036DAC78B
MLTTNYNVLLSIIFNLLLVILFLVLSKKLFNNGITGMLASLLGAYVGTVIAYMTFISSISVVIVDILFIIFIFLLLFFVDRS